MEMINFKLILNKNNFILESEFISLCYKTSTYINQLFTTYINQEDITEDNNNNNNNNNVIRYYCTYQSETKTHGAHIANILWYLGYN